MTRSRTLHLLPLLLVGAAFGFASCKEEGPAEKAGRKIDDAAEKVGEKAEKAWDKTKEVAGDAADKAEEAAQKAKDAVTPDDPDKK